MKWLKNIFSRETISYGICGVITTLINIIIFRVLFGSFNVNYMIANIIAVVLAKTLSFLGNKFFVFQSHSKDKNKLFSEVTKYVLSRTFTGLIDILGMLLAVEVLHADKMISKYIIQVITITINYILTKNVVFKDTIKSDSIDRKTARKMLKKERKKYISPWKGLTIWSLIFSIGFGSIAIVLPMVETLANLLPIVGGKELWQPVNKNENAIYYKPDFKTKEEMADYGEKICRQVEGEGAVLLKNENNALPLAKGSKVSCFSTSSLNLVYGGTGTSSWDTSIATTLKQGLEEAGISINETLWNFYASDSMSKYRRKQINYLGIENVLYEAPWSKYTDEVIKSVDTYNDAAIVVFSRQGGEHNDMNTDFLELDGNEKDLLDNLFKLRADGKLKKIIVLINSSNAMKTDFLDNYKIDACINIGSVGQYGINSVAHILAGDINPSGRLVDTWCYDSSSSPATLNSNPIVYEDAQNAGVSNNANAYLIYQEGIYTGYRYYETRYEDYVMGTGNAGDYNYDSIVAFPFGYGLSYTDFKYSDMKVIYDQVNDCYLINVKVTNIGNFAGKEVVQAYFQSPYTDYDKEKGVEKSSVALCGYAKTKVLEPGESEIITISINKRDLASYDAYGAGTYILDAGDYYLTVASNAHSATNQILTAKGFNSQNTNGRMIETADSKLTWKWTENNLDVTTYSKSLNGTPINNKLSIADINLYEGVNEKVTWLSRKDWTGTFPKESVKLTLTPKLIQDLQPNQYQYQKHDTSGYEKPRMGAKNGLKLYDMLGKDYNDPEWSSLLDQLTYNDMVRLLAAFHSRYAIESISSPSARDENGTAGLNTHFLRNLRKGAVATAFPSSDVVASTFNNELVYTVGKVIGNNCLMADVSCIYAPGANLHRTVFGGRNFEYYSEDAFLTGKMCAVATKGIEEMGVDTLIKHFALNESEKNRIGLGVWINEQTAREIYLKAFQTSFEESKANGVMTSYIRWGAIWSGGFKNLITGILCDEWGCDGWILSDNVRTTMITATDGLTAGLTAFNAAFPAMLNFNKYKNDILIVNLMREACHRNLYALVNSSAMNGIGKDTTIKIVELPLAEKSRYIAIGFGLLTILFSVKWYNGNKKWEKALSDRNQVTTTN